MERTVNNNSKQMQIRKIRQKRINGCKQKTTGDIQLSKLLDNKLFMVIEGIENPISWLFFAINTKAFALTIIARGIDG